jgi:hypothetical protein
MGFFEDLNDNVTGFFGGSSAEKARKNRERANAYKSANKPMPSIQKDLNNRSALAVPNKTSLTDLVNKNTMKPGEYSNSQYQNPRYANKQQFDEANYSGPSAAQVKQKSLFDDLMGKITSEWGGPDKSQIDYSPLDNALNARMGALNGLRDKSQQNFNTSDANLESMHRAFQDHIQTDGASRYNNIADTQKTNLTASNDIAQGNLQKIKADDMAKRQAMLQNLGIEAAGVQEDPSANTLNQAIGSIESREQADLANADQDRATNLAYNQGIATSVGQQGVERRGDLAQQLQAIFGKIDMAGADAQAENAQQRFQLEQNSGDKQYQQWRDNKGFMQDTLGMMQDDAFQRDKLASEQQSQDPATIGGFAGIPQDLVNSGYEVPQIQQAMQALSEITAGDYRKGIDPNAGYDNVSIINRRLQERGIPPMLAIQLATNYAKMGNTSKYQAQEY